MVRHRDTAKTIANAQIQNGQLVVPSNIEVKTEPIGDDTVYLLEMDRNFLANDLTISGAYGINIFDREAIKDVKDPFNPVLKKTGKSCFAVGTDVGTSRENQWRIQ